MKDPGGSVSSTLVSTMLPLNLTDNPSEWADPQSLQGVGGHQHQRSCSVVQRAGVGCRHGAWTHTHTGAAGPNKLPGSEMGCAPLPSSFWKTGLSLGTLLKSTRLHSSSSDTTTSALPARQEEDDGGRLRLRASVSGGLHLSEEC